MQTYRFVMFTDNSLNAVLRLSDGAVVPFDLSNKDFIQFLTDWKAGAEVLNPDGTPAPYSDDAVKALGLGPT